MRKNEEKKRKLVWSSLYKPAHYASLPLPARSAGFVRSKAFSLFVGESVVDVDRVMVHAGSRERDRQATLFKYQWASGRVRSKTVGGQEHHGLW